MIRWDKLTWELQHIACLMLMVDQEGELKHVETGLCLDKGDGAAGSEVGK
jgi:hypothetical protein